MGTGLVEAYDRMGNVLHIAFLQEGSNLDALAHRSIARNPRYSA